MRKFFRGCLVPIFACFAVIGGCEFVMKQMQAHRVAKKLEEVKSLVSVGDDIYEAKEILIENGFRIVAGPSFPTKPRDYMTMHISFGESPSTIDDLIYTMDLGWGGSAISGLIRADPSGKITEIE